MIEENNPKYFQIRDFCKKHSAFSEAQLRWFVQKAPENNFDSVILKIKGRIYVDEDQFFLWLKSQNSVRNIGTTKCHKNPS